MSDKWKDYFIGSVLFIVLVLATNTVIEYILVKTLKMNSSIVVGFMGAILGGGISGALTFFGVKTTINYERNKEELKDLPNKIYNIAVLQEKIELVKEQLKIINGNHLEEAHKILDDKKELINLAISINFDVYKMTKDYIEYLKILEKREKEKDELAKYIKLLYGNTYGNLLSKTNQFQNFLKDELAKLENKIY